jgi:hypothetical protein
VEERLGCRADEGMTRVVAVPLGDGSAVRSALAPPSTADERASLVRISQVRRCRVVCCGLRALVTWARPSTTH